MLKPKIKRLGRTTSVSSLAVTNVSSKLYKTRDAEYLLDFTFRGESNCLKTKTTKVDEEGARISREEKSELANERNWIALMGRRDRRWVSLGVVESENRNKLQISLPSNFRR